MIHRGKPHLGLAIGLMPHEEPKADGEDVGAEAEEKACRELAEVLEVPDEKYDAFREALDAWFDAKESAPHDEEEDGE